MSHNGGLILFPQLFQTQTTFFLCCTFVFPTSKKSVEFMFNDLNNFLGRMNIPGGYTFIFPTPKEFVFTRFLCGEQACWTCSPYWIYDHTWRVCRAHKTLCSICEKISFFLLVFLCFYLIWLPCVEDTTMGKLEYDQIIGILEFSSVHVASKY